MTQEKRRKTDNHTDFTGDIEDMIVNETDQKLRGILIVLNNMCTGMVANTALTKELSESLAEHLDRYTTHVKEFDASKNRRIGWLQGFAALSILAQGVALYYIHENKETIMAIRADGTAHSKELALHDIRLTVIETTMKQPQITQGGQNATLTQPDKSR